jgi:predicted MFS family arabinose efflux permease
MAMSTLMGWAITTFVVVALGSFAVALVSLRKLPLDERPRTRTFDRFGQVVAVEENPDYHENPGETTADEPEVTPPS